MKRPLLIGLLGLAVLIAVPPFLKNYGIYLVTTWLVYVIANMGLNLTVGYAGQKSLGHAAFFGIGAYTVAILMKAGFSFWFGLPVAMFGCFVIGLGLGFPALRVQTIYLAFATLGFNTAVWLVMRNEEWLTGGTFGINNIARPSLFGFSLDGNLAYYYFVLGTAIVFGALLGGVIVGVCENLAAAYISPAYKDAVALVIFMAVILFRPQGLLGQRVERKV